MSMVRATLIGVALSVSLCGAAAASASASLPSIPYIDFCAITQADYTDSNPAIDSDGDGSTGGWQYESKTNGCRAQVADFKIGSPLWLGGAGYVLVEATGDDEASGYGAILNDPVTCSLLTFGVKIYRRDGLTGGPFKLVRSGIFATSWDYATSLCVTHYTGGNNPNWKNLWSATVACKTPAAEWDPFPDTIRIAVWGKFGPPWTIYPSIIEGIDRGQWLQPSDWNSFPTC